MKSIIKSECEKDNSLIDSIFNYPDCCLVAVSRMMIDIDGSDYEFVYPIVGSACGKFTYEQACYMDICRCKSQTPEGIIDCEFMVKYVTENLVVCSNEKSQGNNRKQSQYNFQSITYRVFDLIEPALKQAIDQSIEEHLGQ